MQGALHTQGLWNHPQPALGMDYSAITPTEPCRGTPTAASALE